MKLETFKFIHGILVEKLDKWDFGGDIEKHKQTLSACIELKEVIEVAKKQTTNFLPVALRTKLRLPIRLPFNIEVDV